MAPRGRPAQQSEMESKMEAPRACPPSVKFEKETKMDAPRACPPGAKFEKETKMDAPRACPPGAKFEKETKMDAPRACPPSAKFEKETKMDAPRACPPGAKFEKETKMDAPRACPPGAKFEKEDVSGSYLYMNQFDMVQTQFAFVGLVILYPQKFGSVDATDQDLEGFIHFWKCIGYLLGIDDNFNFCREDDLNFTRQLSRQFIEHLIKPSFKVLSLEYEHMSRAIAQGARSYHPGLTFESLFLYNAFVIECFALINGNEERLVDCFSAGSAV